VTTRDGLRTLCALGLAALAGACAQAPTQSTDDAAPAPRVIRPDGPREDAVKRHRELAREARAAGDLATASDHLHVVAMLADDEAAKRETEALRAEIRRQVREQLEAGRAALRAGESARASTAFLRVLALEPRNAEAARSLRDVDRQNMARAQAARASRVRVEDLFADARAAKSPPAPAAASPYAAPAAAAATTTVGNDAFDLDQRLAMLSAGDTAGALRELKAWVDAHPRDRAARQRIGTAVAERAKDAEAKGQREAALGLYEQAIVLRGEPQLEWSARVTALRKAVGSDYYNDGVKLMRTDLNGAVKAFETSVRYDPQNISAQNRLRDAKAAQNKLSRMPTK
jgi:tetratricopeptide (TPR) repeat protein